MCSRNDLAARNELQSLGTNVGTKARTSGFYHKIQILGFGLWRCCQTNSNQSQFARKYVNLCGTKKAPLGESSGAVELKVLSRVEVTIRIEMV